MAAEPAGDGDSLTLVLGEALVDIVVSPDGSSAEHVGGSPANVAIGLARLGHRVELATHIGDDPRGAADAGAPGPRRRCASPPARSRPNAPRRRPRPWTRPASRRTRSTWPGTCRPTSGRAPPTHVHVGSIATALEPGATQVRRIVAAARAGSTVSFDPNLRPAILRSPEPHRPGVEALVAASDVVKASDEDLAWLYAGEAVDDVLRRWAELGPALVVCTLGGEGARVLVARRAVHRAAAAGRRSWTPSARATRSWAR